MVLVDASTCSEHLQVIRSDIRPRLAESSRDGENGMKSEKSQRDTLKNHVKTPLSFCVEYT
jgi:hypothetical protein